MTARELAASSFRFCSCTGVSVSKSYGVPTTSVATAVTLSSGSVPISGGTVSVGIVVPTTSLGAVVDETPTVPPSVFVPSPASEVVVFGFVVVVSASTPITGIEILASTKLEAAGDESFVARNATDDNSVKNSVWIPD